MACISAMMASNSAVQRWSECLTVCFICLSPTHVEAWEDLIAVRGMPELDKSGPQARTRCSS